jgi:WD40 repeat protein
MYSHNGYVNTCKFSKKGNYFATAGNDGNCIIWNTNFIIPTNETINQKKDICKSGHRLDERTISCNTEKLRAKSSRNLEGIVKKNLENGKLN